jgi:hypothetical protein
MSNNIYDILKKMQSLEAPAAKTQLTESRSMNTVKELHHESKKEKQTRKGTIAEAVAQVEQQLNEKYMGFKKAAAAGKKLGEGGLDPNLKSPNFDKYNTMDRAQQARTGKYEPDVGSIGAWEKDVQGQQKYKSRTEPGIINKVKDTFGLDKPDPAYGPKTNEGAVEESGLQAYLGKKKYGETGMKALQKAGRDGASKEKMAMIRARHDKMDEASPGSEEWLRQSTASSDDVPQAAEMPTATRPGPGSDDWLRQQTAQTDKVQSNTPSVEPSAEPSVAPSAEPNKPGRTSYGPGYNPNEPDVKSDTKKDKPKSSYNINAGTKAYQNFLNKEYSTDLKVDGAFGPKTKAAARAAGDAMMASRPQFVSSSSKDYENYKKQMAAWQPKFDKFQDFQGLGNAYNVKAGKDNVYLGGPRYNQLLSKYNLDSKTGLPIEPKLKEQLYKEGDQLPAPPDEVHLPKKGSKHGPVDVYKKPKNEDMLSAKDKSFAALAEPRDKITYADKIAGAKKGKKTEGNKFSGNLMKARAQGLDKADLDGDGDMEKVTKGASTMREGWEEMQKYLDKKRGPESKGGAGKKAGTRYGGSAQQDDDEETDGEGKPVEKKKGRPKGTGTGAKHSFKKPKD